MSPVRVFIGAAVFAAACFFTPAVSDTIGLDLILGILPTDCLIAMAGGIIIYSGVKK